MKDDVPKPRTPRQSARVFARSGRSLLRSLMVSVVVAAVCAAPPVVGTAIAQTAPSHVSITLYGCSFSATVTIPAGGPCLDRQYTEGNLGTGWNELDLVPFRLITIANNSAPAIQTYDVAIMADFERGTVPGFDVISVPVLNTALSSPSCALVAVGPQTTGPTVGANISNYRMLTVTQTANTTCVFDYYARLAIGSHLYPGSSLHGYWALPSLSVEEIVPLPVGLAQGLSKDMTASRNTSFIWNMATKVEPARLEFTNTCDTTATRSASGNITVSWTKLAAQPSGDVYVVTNVYASNPSSRPITVSVTDVIRSGTTAEDTASVSKVTVPANTRLLVMTHTASLNPASLPSPPNLNDVATATYTDPVSGVAIPQTTTASASANVENAPPQNTAATITDSEGISGSGLSYSVDSVSLSGGSLAGGYVLGTRTTGPVTWTSPTQSDSGSATFRKTVYVSPAAATGGALTTTSLLSGSNGYTAQDQGTASIVASGQGAPTSSVSLVTNGANITVRAPYAGLNTITVNSSSNANVTIPTFTPGTTDPVVVSATRQNPSLPGHLSLTATSIGGCPTTIDPLMTTVVRDTGKPVTDTYTGIAQDESLLLIANGIPGVQLMSIAVNGHSVASLHLHDGEQRSLDLSSALAPGDNTLSVTRRGRPGGSATLMVMNPSGRD